MLSSKRPKKISAARSGWTEQEVRAAVKAYFILLDAEHRGQRTNKKRIYSALHNRFRRRSVKAFERKFFNISAILYEQRLPYCAGLKPNFHYQTLLKLIVLDRIGRTRLPADQPHDILFTKLKEIRDGGPLAIKSGRGTGRYGLAIEGRLGIPPNSSKHADFMGIELKTKTDTTPHTLFSRVPSRYVKYATRHAFFQAYGRRKRIGTVKRLCTSLCGTKPDSQGFRLRVTNSIIQVVRGRDVMLEYDAEDIETALLSKHSQTAFITLAKGRKGGKEYCTLEAVRYCKWPSVIRFLRLVQDGVVRLDFTMAAQRGKGVKDHGFLWRIPVESLGELYLHHEDVDLNRNIRVGHGRSMSRNKAR